MYLQCVTSLFNIVPVHKNYNMLVFPYMYPLSVTLVDKIPSTGWQNTDKVWNRLMLQCCALMLYCYVLMLRCYMLMLRCYTLMLCCYNYRLPIHTSLQRLCVTLNVCTHLYAKPPNLFKGSISEHNRC